MEKEKYYIKTNDNDGKLFIFVYDEELSNDKNGVCPDFKNKKKYDQKELEHILSKGSSINLFGDRAVKTAIQKGYIHPESVGEIKGITCSIFIR